MLEFLSRVKRVSHVNRVSSKIIADRYLMLFVFLILFISIFTLGKIAAIASDITSQAIVNLANNDRISQGLPPLVENEKLSEAALLKAQDMVAKNYFAHTSPDGATPWHWIDKVNYDYNYAGENLAMDFTSPEKMNQAWITSPTHRANIMNEKYTDIGVGIQQGVIEGHETIVVVQVFGSGDKSAPDSVEERKRTPNNGYNNNNTNTLPELPAGNEGKILFDSFKPIITYPINGGTINSAKLSITGRALPQKIVAIYDGNNLLGSAMANSDGWFKISAENFGPGSHSLIAKSQNATKVETLSSSVISFTIDSKKPEIHYELQQNDYGDSDGSYLLSITVNKPNCSISLAGSTYVYNGDPITVLVSERMLSVVIRVEDAAGNSAYDEALFSNFSKGSNTETLLSKFAKTMTKDSELADSGRKEIINNLGLAPTQFPSSLLAGNMQ